MVWEEEYWHAIVARLLQSLREAGLLVHLPIWVESMAIITALAWRFCGGCFADRGGGGDRGRDRERLRPLRSRVPGRFAGGRSRGRPLIEAVITDSRAAGQGVGVQWSQWVSAILYNGLGRYEEALAEAQQAAEQAPELFISMWALPELIEAASRTGQTAAGRRRARPAGRGHQHRPDRLGAGDLRALPGAAQRRPGRRGLVSRGGRPAEPHPPSSRAGPRAPALR